MAMCPTDLSEEKRAVWNVESLTIRGRGFCLITLIRSYLAKLFPMRRIALLLVLSLLRTIFLRTLGAPLSVFALLFLRC
jgi:hypothetical protein